MSMSKRIIAVMVAAIMVMAMGVCTVSAAAVVDKFEVIEFSILNAAGTDADTIGADKTVTLRTTLKRVAGANNTAVEANIIAAVYSDSEMVAVGASEKVYFNYGTVQVNDIELTIPAGKENLTFKAFLWDGDMITPLAKSSDEAEITGIVFGGTEIDFDADVTSYDVAFPVGTPAEPAVYVEANGITNADVAYDDGVATISTINGDYTINYTIAQPTLIAKYEGASCFSTEESGRLVVELTGRQVLREADDALLNPATETTTMTDVTGTPRTNVDNYASSVFNDTWSYFTDVPDALVGKTRVVYNYYNGASWQNNNGGESYYDWYITIDADTRIWYSSQDYCSNPNKLGCAVQYLGADGVVGGGDDVSVTYSKTAYGPDFKYVVDGRGGTSTTPIANLAVTGLTKATVTNTASIEYHNIYTADLILPEGVTSATYRVGGSKDTGAPAIFCYEFLTDDAVEASTPLTFNATVKNNAGVDTRVPVGNIVRKPIYVYDEANDNYQLGVTLDDAAATIYSTAATRLNAHDYAFIQNCPDEMVGASGTTWNNGTFGLTSEVGSAELTITVNRDATLYFDTTDEYAAKAGAVALAPIIYRTAGNGYSVVEGYTFANTGAENDPAWHGGRLFKLELDVPDGAASATFVMPLSYYGSQYPFFFIK